MVETGPSQRVLSKLKLVIEQQSRLKIPDHKRDIYDGVDMGLAILEDENGVITFQVPESENPLEFLTGASPLSINDEGGVDINLKNYNVTEGEGTATVNLTGTFTLTSDDTATLELELRGQASDPAEGDGNITVRLVGDFSRGEPDFSPISEKIAGEILQHFDNPKPKYAHLFVRLTQLMEDLTED